MFSVCCYSNVLARAELRQNDFGGVLGGLIKKDTPSLLFGHCSRAAGNRRFSKASRLPFSSGGT